MKNQKDPNRPRDPLAKKVAQGLAIIGIIGIVLALASLFLGFPTKESMTLQYVVDYRFPLCSLGGGILCLVISGIINYLSEN